MLPILVEILTGETLMMLGKWIDLGYHFQIQCYGYFSVKFILKGF